MRILLHDHDPLLGIDPKSTGKLEITASWEEIIGNNQPQKVVQAPVQTINVHPNDNSLQDVIRHELGDTRHRIITYTLTAVSRFRRFFEDSHENLFVTKKEFTVNVPSSARPSPPVVGSVLPALVWKDNREDDQFFMLRRKRLGGYIRIELKDPWNETGEGEEFAVLVYSDNNPPDKVWPYITQVGRDPIHQGPTPDRWLTAADFSLASGEPREVYLEEVGMYVMAVPHKPWYKDGHWYVDIAIPRLGQNVYSPFLRLAVARYQPNTIKDINPLSSVVMTDMVQLLPERTLFIRVDGNKVLIKLRGIGPYSDYYPNQWRVFFEKFQSQAEIDPDKVDLTLIDGSADGIPAWVPVENLYRGAELNKDIEPIPLPAEDSPFRIRIQEIESLQSPEAASGPGSGFESRTVYSDVIPLPEIEH